jgi:hypothetical protein
MFNNTREIIDGWKEPTWKGNILETSPLLMIPTDPDELAVLLDVYSRDWAENLFFLSNLAKKFGIPLDTALISEKILELIGEE